MRVPRYIKINMTTLEIGDYHISEEYSSKYIGGKTLGARLLLDLTEAGVDPLSEESVIIINTSPLNGTGAPATSRFNITFKNLLTGGIASSNCGGPFGVMLKKAGFDGVIIVGKAEEPTHINFSDGKVTLMSAKDLWGLDAEHVQEKLPKHYGKLVIGPGGENLVKYAGTLSGERIAGRCGSGAILGSKNIKALTAYGTKKIQVENEEKFYKYVKKWVKFLRKHPMTGNALPSYGSAGLVNKANATGALPTHNFKQGYFEGADAISGEMLAEKELTRNGGCVSCPIRCERRVNVYGKEVKGPEFETVGFFGSNIDSDNLPKISELNYIADIMGLDTISLASTIAFAMELKEKGLADFELEFGKTENIEEVIKKIAYREGKYSELANGTKWLAEKYGGKEFAINAKGLELASYEPRRSVGMGLGYATSNRGGCHLNGGYLALLEAVGVLSIDAQTPKAKSQLTIFLQNALEAVSASGCCLFSAQSFVPAIFFKLGPNHKVTRLTGKIMKHMGSAIGFILKHPKLLFFNSMAIMPHGKALGLAIGRKMTIGEFVAFGERGFNVERLFNIREGLSGKDDTLPERLTKTPQIEGRPDTVVPLDKMLPTYYKVRGWSQDGIPTKEKLRKLEVDV